jgi:AmmeMemoRadiSam system protein B
MRIRPAAVAGTFYPQEPDELARMIDDMLVQAKQTAMPEVPKALIVPHAGYIYSGPIAASAYARLAPFAEGISRIILLGPTHRVPVHGLALPDAEAFATPLGSVPLDVESMRNLDDLPQVSVFDASHATEHSLEVQIPFLQKVLGVFSLIPLAVGDASPEEVAEVLDRLWGGSETVIVISSDLSHYLPYDLARDKDRQTTDGITAQYGSVSHDRACGATPINGLLAAAKKHPMRARLIDLRNSGDTAGDKTHVVGYAAFTFAETRDTE